MKETIKQKIIEFFFKEWVGGLPKIIITEPNIVPFIDGEQSEKLQTESRPVRLNKGSRLPVLERNEIAFRTFAPPSANGTNQQCWVNAGHALPIKREIPKTIGWTIIDKLLGSYLLTIADNYTYN